MFWRVGIARNAVFFRSFVASKARKGRSEKRGGAEDRVPKMSTKFAPRLRARAIWKSKSLKTGAVKLIKNWRCRSTFGSWHRQNLHHACARERFGSQNRSKLACREHFWKLTSTKFAPRLRARAICTKKRHDAACSEHFWKLSFAKFTPRLRARTIWKSKSLKHQVLGTFLEVESGFRVAGAGISTRCKIRGRRRSSWGLQKRWQAWWIWRGSETMLFAWQAQGFRALWCRCLKHPTLNPWEGCKFHVTEVLLCRDHFAWQLQEFVCLGSTFSWQAQYFWSIQLKIVKTYCNSEVKCLVDMSFLKEVSQKSFVFELQSCKFEGSLAEMLRFSASQLQVWRKSRRKASFDKIIWITHRLTTKSLEPQIDLTSKSFESQINWQPAHLNLKSVDNQISWISDQLTTESFEFQINWQPHHLKFKSTDNRNHLKHTPIDNQIIWISNQLTTKSFDSQLVWIWHQLTFEPIELRTLPSYRFLIFGNFRHRLVR